MHTKYWCLAFLMLPETEQPLHVLYLYIIILYFLQEPYFTPVFIRTFQVHVVFIGKIVSNVDIWNYCG